MHEVDWNIFSGRVESGLEPRPETLRLSTINTFGLDISELMSNLGFRRLRGSKVGNLVLMSTPERLMDKEWAMFYQDKKADSDLFTIYLNHGGDVGYVDFLRQTENQHGYVIFFP